MRGSESFSHRPSSKVELATVEDFADSPQIQQMLRRLPPELQGLHATKIIDLPEKEAFAYLHDVLESRESATRESVVSDESFAPYFHTHETEIWKALEGEVFTDTENFLGAGQTARIKSYETEQGLSLAIKYLLTPSAKTLSVSGEHDLIKEVERVRAIEKAEKEASETDLSLRVPHPYFYYKKGKIQCYGMELIDGINLEQGIAGEYDEKTGEALRSTFEGVSRETLAAEIEQFFDAMHTVCLHGDIKPANIMVSREGKFYVIDFGQSVLTNDVDDKSRDAFEVLKQDEKDGTRSAINFFLSALYREEAKAA